MAFLVDSMCTLEDRNGVELPGDPFKDKGFTSTDTDDPRRRASDPTNMADNYGRMTDVRRGNAKMAEREEGLRNSFPEQFVEMGAVGKDGKQRQTLKLNACGVWVSLLLAVWGALRLHKR